MFNFIKLIKELIILLNGLPVIISEIEKLIDELKNTANNINVKNSELSTNKQEEQK